MIKECPSCKNPVDESDLVFDHSIDKIGTTDQSEMICKSCAGTKMLDLGGIGIIGMGGDSDGGYMIPQDDEPQELKF